MNESQGGVNRVLKMFFGVFMVLVYLGMAVLMALNYFNLPEVPRWIFAVVLFAYGIYRGYREVTGEHTYGMRRMDDDSQYTTYSSSDAKEEDQ